MTSTSAAGRTSRPPLLTALEPKSKVISARAVRSSEAGQEGEQDHTHSPQVHRRCLASELLQHPRAGVQVCQCAGVQVCRCEGMQVRRCAGVQGCRCAGVQVCRCAGVHPRELLQAKGYIFLYIPRLVLIHIQYIPGLPKI